MIALIKIPATVKSGAYITHNAALHLTDINGGYRLHATSSGATESFIQLFSHMQ